MEFAVIKIIDGLLISDSSITKDHEFLYNNKISHTIGWLSSTQYNNQISQNLAFQLEDIGIKSVVVLKKDNSMPSAKDIEVCIQTICQSRDQYLCTLIYSEEMVEGLVICIPYFIFRYGWSIESSIGFIQKRLSFIQNSIPKYSEYMSNMRSGLTAVLQAMLGVNLSKLKYIEWSWGFLREFRTDDVEEMVLINTVRNAMGDNQIQCSLNNNQNSITKQKSSMNAKNNWTSCNEDEDGEQILQFIQNNSNNSQQIILRDKVLKNNNYMSNSNDRARNQTQNYQNGNVNSNISSFNKRNLNDNGGNATSNVNAGKDKNRRIQWIDQVSKNSITAGQRLFANSKINSSLRKTSSLKNTQFRTNTSINKSENRNNIISINSSNSNNNEAINWSNDPYSSYNNISNINSTNLNNRNKIKLTKKHNVNRTGSSKKTVLQKQAQFEDLQYLSLKQLSRTNFEDLKFRNVAIQKRRSLRVNRSNQNKSVIKDKDKEKGKDKFVKRSSIKIGQEFYNSTMSNFTQFINNTNSNNKVSNFIQGIKVLDNQNNSLRA